MDTQKKSERPAWMDQDDPKWPKIKEKRDKKAPPLNIDWGGKTQGAW